MQCGSSSAEHAVRHPLHRATSTTFVRFMAVVLIVEKDISAANAMASALEQEGFAVVRAENGRNGLAQSVPERFDAIVLERLLPELDGRGLPATCSGHRHELPVRQYAK